MKEFDYLKEHALFRESKEYEKFIKYEFGRKDETLFAHGVFMIPKDETGKFEWMYREIIVDVDGPNIFLDSGENTIEHLPKDWFYTLTQEAQNKLIKRNRLRLLFVKS